VSSAASLRGLADTVRPLALARERSLPVPDLLAGLLPSGTIQRGSTVLVTSDSAQLPGATSLAFALIAAASTSGSWCAAVGFPELGAVAITELGVDLRRLALIPRLEPGQWTPVVGALLDAVDVVIVRPPARLRIGDARRVVARARERGTVLLPVGTWVEGVDLRLAVTGSHWIGLGAGDGFLRARRLEVSASGRGAATRARHATVWLPPDPAATAGGVQAFAGADAHLIPDPSADAGPLRSAG
jgi:hypothetical protein